MKEMPSLSDLQKELKEQSVKDVLRIAMRLAKYKKENKELLYYLLHFSGNESGYVEMAKEEMTTDFNEINRTNLYLAKKTLRKVVRKANKYVKFSDVDQTDLEIRMHLCLLMCNSGIKFHGSKVIMNIYKGQVLKIEKTFSKMHEDLRHDFKREYDLIMAWS